MPHNCKIFNETDLDLSELIDIANQLLPHAESVMGFSEPVTVSLISDQENSINPLGKTAYYDPGEMAISLFVDGRHPKDILRSLSHELVHHTQNCNGMFDEVGEMGPGYAQENKHLREMEREAYEIGNMFFRDWEDEYKKKQNWELNEGFKDMAKNIGSFLTDPERGLKGKLGRGVASIGGDDPGLLMRGLKGFAQAGDPIGSLPTFSPGEKSKPYFSDEPSNPSGKGPYWDQRPETIDPDISRYRSYQDPGDTGESHASRKSRGESVADWIEWIMLHDGEEDIKKAFYSVIYDEEVESTTKMSVYKRYSKIINARGYDKPTPSEEGPGTPPTETAPTEPEDPPLSAEPPPVRPSTASPITPPMAPRTIPMGRPPGAPPRRVNPREGKSMTLSEITRRLTRLTEEVEELNYQDHIGDRFQAIADGWLESQALGADPYDIEVTETGFKVVGVPEGREEYLDREFTPEGTEGYNPMHWNVAMRELRQAIDAGALQRPTNLPATAPMEPVPALQESLSFSEELKIRASVQSAIKLMEHRHAKRIRAKKDEYEKKNLTSREVNRITELAGIKLSKESKRVLQEHWSWRPHLHNGSLRGSASTADYADQWVSDRASDVQDAGEALNVMVQTHGGVGGLASEVASEAWEDFDDMFPDITFTDYGPLQNAHKWSSQEWFNPNDSIDPTGLTSGLHWLGQSIGTNLGLTDLNDEDSYGGSWVTDHSTGERHYFMPGGEAQYNDEGELLYIDDTDDYDAAAQVIDNDWEQSNIIIQKIKRSEQHNNWAAVEADARRRIEAGQEWVDDHTYSAREMRALNVQLTNDAGDLIDRGTEEYYTEMDKRRVIIDEACAEDDPNCTRFGGFRLRSREVRAGAEKARQASAREIARIKGGSYINRRGEEVQAKNKWDMTSPYPRGRFLRYDIENWDRAGLGTTQQAMWTTISTVAYPLGIAQGIGEWGLDTLQVPYDALQYAIRGIGKNEMEKDQLAYEIMNNQIAWSDWVLGNFAPILAGGMAGARSFVPSAMRQAAGLAPGRGVAQRFAARTGALIPGGMSGLLGGGAADGNFNFTVRRGNRYYGDHIESAGDMFRAGAPWAPAQYGYGSTETSDWRNLGKGEIDRDLPYGEHPVDFEREAEREQRRAQAEADFFARTGNKLPKQISQTNARAEAIRQIQAGMGLKPGDYQARDEWEPIDITQYEDQPLLAAFIEQSGVDRDSWPTYQKQMFEDGYCTPIGITGVSVGVVGTGGHPDGSGQRYHVQAGPTGTREICGLSTYIEHRIDQTADIHYLESGASADGSFTDREGMRDSFVRDGMASDVLRDELRGVDDEYASMNELMPHFDIDNYGSNEAINEIFAEAIDLANQPDDEGRIVTDEDLDLHLTSDSLAASMESVYIGERSGEDLTPDEVQQTQVALNAVLDSYIERCSYGEDPEACDIIRRVIGVNEATFAQWQEDGGWEHEARIMLYSKVALPYATQAEKMEDIAGNLRSQTRQLNIWGDETAIRIASMSDQQVLNDPDIIDAFTNPDNPFYNRHRSEIISTKLRSRVIEETSDASLLLSANRAEFEEVEMAHKTNAVMNTVSDMAREEAIRRGGIDDFDAAHNACMAVAGQQYSQSEPSDSALYGVGCTIRRDANGEPTRHTVTHRVRGEERTIETGQLLWRPFEENEFLSSGQEGISMWAEGSMQQRYSQWLTENNYDDEFILTSMMVNSFEPDTLQGVMAGSLPSEAFQTQPARESLVAAPDRRRVPVYGPDNELIGWRDAITGDSFRAAQESAHELLAMRSFPEELRESRRWTRTIIAGLAEAGDTRALAALQAGLARHDNDGDGIPDEDISMVELINLLDNPPVLFQGNDLGATEGEIWHLDSQADIEVQSASSGTHVPLSGYVDWGIGEEAHVEYLRRQGTTRRAVMRVALEQGLITQEAYNELPEIWLHPERSQTRQTSDAEHARRWRQENPDAAEHSYLSHKDRGTTGISRDSLDDTVQFHSWFQTGAFLNADGDESQFVVHSYNRGITQLSYIVQDARAVANLTGNTGLHRSEYDEDTWIGGKLADWGSGPEQSVLAQMDPREQADFTAQQFLTLWDPQYGVATDSTRQWLIQTVPHLVMEYLTSEDIMTSHILGEQAISYEPVWGEPEALEDDPDTVRDESQPRVQRDDLGVLQFTGPEPSPTGEYRSEYSAARMMGEMKRIMYARRGRAVDIPALTAAGPQQVWSATNEVDPITNITIQHQTNTSTLSQQQLDVDQGRRSSVSDWDFYVHPDPAGEEGTRGNQLVKVGYYSPSTNTVIITDARHQTGNVIITDPAEFIATQGFLESYIALQGVLGLGTPPAIIYQTNRGPMYVDPTHMLNPDMVPESHLVANPPHLPEGRVPGDRWRAEEQMSWVDAGGAIHGNDNRAIFPETQSDAPVAEPYPGDPDAAEYTPPPPGPEAEERNEECGDGMFWNGAGCVECDESAGMVWDPQTLRCVEPQATPDRMSGDQSPAPSRWRLPDESRRMREGKENNHTKGFLSNNKLVIEQISKALSNKNIKLPRKKLEEVIRKQIMSNLKQGVKE